MRACASSRVLPWAGQDRAVSRPLVSKCLLVGPSNFPNPLQARVYRYRSEWPLTIRLFRRENDPLHPPICRSVMAAAPRRTVPASSPFIFAAAFSPLPLRSHITKAKIAPGWLVGLSAVGHRRRRVESVAGRVGRLIGRLLACSLGRWVGRPLCRINTPRFLSM